MPLVTSKEMFEKAYKGGYAIGAFNVNNMEMIQAIVEAANECKSPVIFYIELLDVPHLIAKVGDYSHTSDSWR